MRLALDDSDADLQAIEAGLASIDRDEDGVSVDEAFDRIRQKHRIQG